MTPPALPEGTYPYNDRVLPLAELVFVEAPPELQALLVGQAKANGTDIIRDVPVEIRCMHEGHVEATFVVWWPHGHAEMHVLMPREYVRGRA